MTMNYKLVMTPKERFIRACRCEPVDRPPVWMMRQAGRYLPEYREIRRQKTTLQMMKEPDVACEITLQPIGRLGVDAAILYSDILIVPEAMGLKLDFVEGTGPTFENPVQTPQDIQSLREKDVPDRCRFVFQAIQKIRGVVGPDFPVLGFAGAPFTVATYMMGGQNSNGGTALRQLAQKEGPSYQLLMEKLVAVTTDYLLEQWQSGVDAIQVFDTWAGTLSTGDYEELVLPYSHEVLSSLQKKGIPTLHYIKGGGPLFPSMLQASSDVISVDWNFPLSQAKALAQGCVAIQGNFDPAILLTSPEKIQEGVRRMIADWGKGPGYIINLGHGILPETPVENAQAFVDAAKKYGRETCV